MPSRDEATPLKAAGSTASQRGGGSFVSSLFCGSECCRRDAKAEEFAIQAEAPTAYPKAEKETNEPTVKMPSAGTGPDTTTQDQSVLQQARCSTKVSTSSPKMEAEDVDAENASGGTAEHFFMESGESGSENSETEDDSTNPRKDRQQPQAVAKADHRKSIELLKESFEPVQKNLQANPSPQWRDPNDRLRPQDIDDEDDSESSTEESEQAPRPSQRRREIEDLKRSYEPLTQKQGQSKNNQRDNARQADQRFEERGSAPSTGQRASKNKNWNASGSVPSTAERKKKKCTIQ